MENNTLELQLLSEFCRVLAISNVQTAILRWILSVSGILTRFPCSANKNACPKVFRRLDGQRHACLTCPGRAFATKAMVCNFRYNCSRFLRIKLRKARFLRETLHKEFPLFSPKTGTTPFTVGLGNTAFADARLHCKPLHLTYQRFCCLALLRQNRVRSIKKPLLFS